MSTVNRKYKDSVFVDLFAEDEKAKALFDGNLRRSCVQALSAQIRVSSIADRLRKN